MSIISQLEKSLKINYSDRTMRMALLSLLGLGLTIGGIYLMYVYIISLNTESNILFLILSFALIGAGVFVLVVAGKADTMILKRASKPESDTTQVITPVKEENFASKLEENNKLMSEWKKTNETKQRLRMLEISAASEESK